MACPPTYYGGFKAARVKRFGAGERSLSHIRTGDLTENSFDFEIWDGDRLINGWLASLENRYWTEALTIRMVHRDVRRVLGLPYTVFSGPIINAKPNARPRSWAVTLGDRVSQALLSDTAEAPWRRIGDGFLSQLTKKADDIDSDTPEPIIYGAHTRYIPGDLSGNGLVYQPTYLGIMPHDGVDSHVWLVAGHACAGSPFQLVDGVVSGEFTFEKSIEFLSDTFGNTRRYALLFAPVTDPGFLDPDVDINRDPDVITDPDACALNIKTLKIAVEGVEPNGDGTGAVIKRRLLQYLHFCVNYVANHGPESYMSGPWLENPEWTVSDGPVPIVEEDTFTEADAIAFERFPADDGYTGAGIIGARTGGRKPTRDWMAEWNRSCSCRSGFTHKGQLRVKMLHPTAAIKAAAPLFDDALEILEGTFDPNVLWSEHATVIPFLADPDHGTGNYTTSSAATSADKNYVRAIPGETRTYPFAPGITNSWHLAAIELYVFQYPPRTVQFETTLTGLATLDLGDYFRYRHFATITDTVGQIRLAQITRHQVQAGARRVLVEALDCEDLIGFDVPGGSAGAASLNDRCSRATEFVFTEPAEGMSWWQRFTQNTTPQTEDTSIAALVSPNSDQKPAWFKFTAPSDGNLSIITTTSAYDTVLYLLDGVCGGAWTILNQGDDQVGNTAAATVDLVWGQTVYILIIGKTDDDFGYLLAQASFAPA